MNKSLGKERKKKVWVGYSVFFEGNPSIFEKRKMMASATMPYDLGEGKWSIRKVEVREL